MAFSKARVVPIGLAAAAVFLLAACATATPTPTVAAPTAVPPTALPVPTQAPTPTPAPLPTATPLGFTPGTKESPRMIAIDTNDQLAFAPAVKPIAEGETITFQLTNSGKADHEFMVGPLDAVIADTAADEIAAVAPGKTETITVTFNGPGPFGFACHAPGHFEAGMIGYLPVTGPDVPTLGTKAAPRLVAMNMDDTLKFMPDQVVVAKGETITFLLTNSGKIVHEFAVGQADMVDADVIDGVLVIEQDEIVTGSVKAVTYTFDGTGPYAFACHEPGHYQAGMKGAILLTTP